MQLDGFKDLLECFWLKVDYGDEFDHIAQTKFNEATKSSDGICKDEFMNYYNTLINL